MHRFTFRCECGVLVLTDDPMRFKCRSCEPHSEPFDPKEFHRKTRMLHPPKKEKTDDDGKT